jgi:hypothetical protein
VVNLYNGLEVVDARRDATEAEEGRTVGWQVCLEVRGRLDSLDGEIRRAGGQDDRWAGGLQQEGSNSRGQGWSLEAQEGVQRFGMASTSW